MKPLTKIAAGPSGMQRQLAAKENTKWVFDNGSTVMFRGEPTTPLKSGGGLHLGETPEPEVSETSAATLKSRAKNPEAYRAYQREYMRKRRAKPSP